jgi:hypothetical protein
MYYGNERTIVSPSKKGAEALERAGNRRRNWRAIVLCRYPDRQRGRLRARDDIPALGSVIAFYPAYAQKAPRPSHVAGGTCLVSRFAPQSAEVADK